MYNVDVIIIGGGMTGLALACGLQQDTKLSVAVLEYCKPPEQMKPSSKLSKTRVSTINTASKKLLSYLGVWQIIIDNYHISSFQNIEIWNKDSFGHIIFNRTGTNYNNLGYVIEDIAIHSALWQRAQQHSGIMLIAPMQIQQIIRNESNVRVILQDGNILTARLLVGADGANSWLRYETNIPLIFWNYYHHALITTVRTTKPHDAIARQVFHKNSILAFLPLNDPHLNSIVWSLENDKAQQMLRLTPKMFNQALCVAFDNRLGLCNIENERQIFPIIGRYAKQFASHRLVLIGDAAHTIHLLAGQGVNMGFMDVAKLIGELHQLHLEGKDIGQYHHLRHYELSRKYSTAVMLAGIHNIYKIFNGSNLAKNLLRNFGMRITNALPNIKLYLLRQAMGFNDLPNWLVNLE